MSQLEKRKKRANIVVEKLKELFPKADTVLNWSNPWQLMVAVMLSAQCTDKKVNEVTEELFKKYKTVKDYVVAKPEVFEQEIRSTGFYRNKTKNILACARIIKDKFNSRVPDTMAGLMTLPGIARKSANIILFLAYRKIDGIAVDTHVKRLSRKFKLTDNIDQNKIEQDLIKILPRNEWMNYTFRMVMYGRLYSPAFKKSSIQDPISQELSKEKLI